VFEGPEGPYLRTAQNHATQDDIRKRMGQPPATQPLETGETVWQYEYYGYHGGDRNTPGQIWCDRYSLAFDNQSVLRHWDYHWDRTCIW
jgi:hypothetical protein